MNEKIKTRLFVEAPLAAGSMIELAAPQAHYLLHTLRSRVGERVALFNGTDGEWLGEIFSTGKKTVQVAAQVQNRPQKNAPDAWLVFAPVKNEKIDFMVKRAVELGVSRLLPVMTRHTVVSRLNMERLHANATEAAEQCGRMDVPQLVAPQKLSTLLGNWPASRLLIHCDESGSGTSVKSLLPGLKPSPLAVLTGPEGGFAPDERAMIAQVKGSHALSLGPRILRAETAALAALANVQAWLGDWDEAPRFVSEAK